MLRTNFHVLAPHPDHKLGNDPELETLNDEEPLLPTSTRDHKKPEKLKIPEREYSDEDHGEQEPLLPTPLNRKDNNDDQ